MTLETAQMVIMTLLAQTGVAQASTKQLSQPTALTTLQGTQPSPLTTGAAPKGPVLIPGNAREAALTQGTSTVQVPGQAGHWLPLDEEQVQE